MTRAFILALCLIFGAGAALAQNTESGTAGGSADISGSGTGVPSTAAGDVAASGSGAITQNKSGIGDRRTLDDLKAGTSGSTQTR